MLIKERPVFVLGAPDPEMTRIEAVLTSTGTPYLHALYNGDRVNSRTAYEADSSLLPEIGLVFVESAVQGRTPVAVIDHHRAGDPGFSLTEKDSLRASSLGQVCRMLHIDPTHEDRVLAAMDHNFAAALRGEAVGVTAKEVLERKIREVAKSSGETINGVKTMVGDFRRVIKQAGKLTMSTGTKPVSDLREVKLGYGYSFDHLALQIAVVAMGACAIVTNQEALVGKEKVMLTGHASPQQVTAFMEEWALSEKLSGIYGVPARGYAGGYRMAP